MSENTGKYWSSYVRRIQPYVPGEQPRDRRYIKLNTNENPYGPGERVRAAIANFNVDDLAAYPDPHATALREKLAAYYGVSAAEVFVGNGSDEVLDFAFRAFFDPREHTERPILAPELTYSFYPVYAHSQEINYETVALNADFSINVEHIIRSDAQGIVLANPNAPTGRALTPEDMERLLAALEAAGQFAIIDEAYVDFGGESALRFLDHYDNFLVVQTFSKSRALAGLRLGFAIGRKEQIEALERVRDTINSYTVDRFAQVVGIASLEDEAHFTTICERIVATRDRFTEAANAAGMEVPDSQTNFVLVARRGYSAEALCNYLRSNGVLVRYFNHALLSRYIRISIGTDEEMATVLQLLQELEDKEDE